MTTDWHTPLFNACISGNRECLELLLQNGASFLPMSDLTSPIHEAAKRGKVLRELQFPCTPSRGFLVVS